MRYHRDYQGACNSSSSSGRSTRQDGKVGQPVHVNAALIEGPAGRTCDWSPPFRSSEGMRFACQRSHCPGDLGQAGADIGGRGAAAIGVPGAGAGHAASLGGGGGPACIRREREEFLRLYQRVNAAYDPAGCQRMRRILHVWSLTAIAARQPGYYEELAADRAGTATTAPIADAILDWAERAAARERES